MLFASGFLRLKIHRMDINYSYFLIIRQRFPWYTQANVKETN